MTVGKEMLKKEWFGRVAKGFIFLDRILADFFFITLVSFVIYVIADKLIWGDSFTPLFFWICSFLIYCLPIALGGLWVLASHGVRTEWLDVIEWGFSFFNRVFVDVSFIFAGVSLIVGIFFWLLEGKAIRWLAFASIFVGVGCLCLLAAHGMRRRESWRWTLEVTLLLLMLGLLGFMMPSEKVAF